MVFEYTVPSLTCPEFDRSGSSDSTPNLELEKVTDGFAVVQD
jgi:hypothetical protein